MVFNTKKQYIFAGDAYPRHYVSKLDKGDYILKLQVCHSKQNELKKLTELPLCLCLKLSSPFTMEVTSSRIGLFSGPKLSNIVLKPKVSTPLHLRGLVDEK
jgi:hypothetical protein